MLRFKQNDVILLYYIFNWEWFLMHDKNDSARLALMYRAATLYYEEGKKKTEIAKHLNRSPMTITRLIEEAKKRGMVECTVHPPPLPDKGSQVKERFTCLREAVIITAGETTPHNQESLGREAAKYFDRTVRSSTLQSRMKVGIGGGNTIYEMIMALKETKRTVDIYPTQLIGRGPHIPEHKDPMVLITHLLKQCKGRDAGSTGFYATIPPFEPLRENRRVAPEKISASIQREHQSLLVRKTIMDVWRGMKEVDAIFASVGQLPFTPREKTGGRSMLDLLADMGVPEEWLRKQGAVGDFSYSLFDQNGKTRSPQWDFFLTLGVDHIRTVAADPKRTVVLIVGEGKEKALHAALKGRLCNVLITLDSVANRLLEYPK